MHSRAAVQFAMMALALTPLLGGCEAAENSASRPAAMSNATSDAGEALEQAAANKGLIPDFSDKDFLAGAYERESDLGTDRMCALGDDERGYRIGMVAVFGPDTRCEATGSAARSGENVRMTLVGEKGRCVFTAQFDGVRLTIPGRIDEECDQFCGLRASFAGVSFDRVGDGNSVAASVRGIDVDELCGG
jgi:hypothetical protein